MMNRFSGSIGLVSTAAVLFLAGCGGPVDTRPNVLILSGSEWNDMLGAMGNPNVMTPNLDALAARGILFTKAQTPSKNSAAARTAVLSGIPPWESGCLSDEPFLFSMPDHLGLPQYFKACGYSVYGGGKVYHDAAGYVDLRGFDEWFIQDEALKAKGWPTEAWISGEAVPENRPLSKSAKNSLNYDFGAIPDELEDKMTDTQVVNWAVEVLGRKHKTPFFLAMGLSAPGRPMYVPQKYFGLYPLEKIRLPEVKEDDLDDLAGGLKKWHGGYSKSRSDAIHEHDEAKKTVQAYYAGVSYADAMLGRVLRALEASPYADNTIVVFWSDIGRHLGEKHYWGANNSMWQRTTNVPFIWAGVNVPTNVVSDVPVSTLDTYKTLVELCGLAENKAIQGNSLVEVFESPDDAHDKNVVIAGGLSEFAVVNPVWRYITHRNGEELYDTKYDPHEWKNVADISGNARVKMHLATEIPRAKTDVAPSPQRNGCHLELVGNDFKWVEGPEKKAEK